jgi:hypothetical protein
MDAVMVAHLALLWVDPMAVQKVAQKVSYLAVQLVDPKVPLWDALMVVL